MVHVKEMREKDMKNNENERKELLIVARGGPWDSSFGIAQEKTIRQTVSKRERCKRPKRIEVGY